MSTATQSTSVVSKDGEHWESHGLTVYHAPQISSPGERATAAMVCTYSFGNKHRAGSVLLSVVREPFSMSLHIEPEDAEHLADALRKAAAQARAVLAIKAQAEGAAA